MFQSEYKKKICTPEEAVKVVKSGDWIDYMYFNGYPKALDKALAKRLRRSAHKARGRSN